LAITTKDERRKTKDENNEDEKATFVFRLSSFVPKALLWSLPYALPTVLFVGLRLAGDASIGGYQNAPTDFQHFFWDALVTAFLAMLMPLNRLVFGETLAQVAGLAMTILVIGALILWGRRRWPTLLLGLVWWLVFLVPGLNLIRLDDNPANLQNRIYYLSLMGFCLGLGALLSVPLEQTRPRARRATWAVVGVALLIAIPIAWRQLQPWTQASRQTRHIVDELTALLPGSDGLSEINAHSLPLDYDGAYVFWNGLDGALRLFSGQSTRVNNAEGLDAPALAAPLGEYAGRWNLDFNFDPDEELFYVSGLSGVSRDMGPPTEPGTRVWDFGACEEGLPPGTQVENAETECQGDFTHVMPRNQDPIITLAGVDLEPGSARWVRLAVSSRYAPFTRLRVGEWFWAGEERAWSEQRGARFYLRAGEEWRVYWTYVRADILWARVTDLRFDPINDQVDAGIRWIAVTPIGP
jgi:hypothetical protein